MQIEDFPSLVPKPLAGQQNFFLCLSPEPTWKEKSKIDLFLSEYGIWKLGNTTDRFLCGDGSWKKMTF